MKIQQRTFLLALTFLFLFIGSVYGDDYKDGLEMEGIDDSLISVEEKREAIHKFISDYPDHNPKLNEAQQMLELTVQ